MLTNKYFFWPKFWILIIFVICLFKHFVLFIKAYFYQLFSRFLCGRPITPCCPPGGPGTPIWKSHSEWPGLMRNSRNVQQYSLIIFSSNLQNRMIYIMFHLKSWLPQPDSHHSKRLSRIFLKNPPGGIENLHRAT